MAETKDEFGEKLETFYKAKAKNAAYKDIVDFLEKYDKKVTRMFNEMSQKYERLKKSGKKDVTYYRHFTQKTTLNYQTIEAKALRVEFLERYIDQSKLLEKAQDELEEVFKRDRESEQPTI